MGSMVHKQKQEENEKQIKLEKINAANARILKCSIIITIFSSC